MYICGSCCYYYYYYIIIIIIIIILGPEHMPRMLPLGLLCDHFNPPYVPTFATRCLHVHTTREILAVKGGTYGREC
jgi:hypothetical protein